MYVYVYMYVCMYASCMYACMYVCMYVYNIFTNTSSTDNSRSLSAHRHSNSPVFLKNITAHIVRFTFSYYSCPSKSATYLGESGPQQSVPFDTG